MNTIIIKIPDYLPWELLRAKALVKFHEIPKLEFKTDYSYLNQELWIGLRHPNFKKSEEIIFTQDWNSNIEYLDIIMEEVK
jgi:hypothetical protein